MATIFRNMDRSDNAYPSLHYPYVYVVEKGFSCVYNKYHDNPEYHVSSAPVTH